MNLILETKLSGRILDLKVLDKHGKVKTHIPELPNIIHIQASWTDAQMGAPSNTHRTFTSTAENFEDLDGTWSQSGNTITRSSGTGTFPSSPSQLGNELYWYDAGGDTGHRCHVTARASDTSITVSGAAKTITAGSLRRFIVNGSGISDPSTGAQQSSTSATNVSNVFDDTTGTRVTTYSVIFPSAVSAYTLGSIIPQSFSRILLDTPIAIEIDDQLQYTYEATETVSGRLQEYELGSESVGIPQKHSMTSIVGNGSQVDVTFSGPTHFAAGDKLDLRGVIPKKIAISSITADGTKWTFNTATAHNLLTSDSVIVEGATIGAYNGTWVVSNVVDADTFEVADVTSPGSSGAAGTVRLATPGSFFDDLGLATIASMPSSSVARITSTMTGPDVEPALIGGDPGVTVVLKRKTSTTQWRLFAAASTCLAFNEANAKAIADETSTGSISTSGSSWAFTTVTETSAAYTNDWTHSYLIEKSAGAGTDLTRLKQILITSSAFSGNETQIQITFNTPFTKTVSDRLRITVSKQLLRTIETP